MKSTLSHQSSATFTQRSKKQDIFHDLNGMHAQRSSAGRDVKNRAFCIDNPLFQISTISDDFTNRKILIVPPENHTKIHIVYNSAARIMQAGILSSKLSAISIFQSF